MGFLALRLRFYPSNMHGVRAKPVLISPCISARALMPTALFAATSLLILIYYTAKSNAHFMQNLSLLLSEKKL
jgi:hypothetical protein